MIAIEHIDRMLHSRAWSHVYNNVFYEVDEVIKNPVLVQVATQVGFDIYWQARYES